MRPLKIDDIIDQEVTLLKINSQDRTKMELKKQKSDYSTFRFKTSLVVSCSELPWLFVLASLPMSTLLMSPGTSKQLR